MKKIILGVFFLLTVVQSNKNFDSFGDGIASSVQAPLKFTALSRVSFNDLNPSWREAVGDLIAFIQPTSSVLIENFEGNDKDRLSSLINDALDLFFDQVISVEDTIYDSYDLLISQNITKKSFSFSSFAITLQLQNVGKISKSVSSLATILTGNRPKSASHVDLKTVNKQAEAFLSISNNFTNELKEIPENYDLLNEQVGGACNCPNNVSIQSLIDKWTTVNANITTHIQNTCKKWSLGEYLGLRSSNNFKTAVDETRKLFDEINGCTKCLIENSVQIGDGSVDEICNASKGNLSILTAYKFSDSIRDLSFKSLKQVIHRISSYAKNLYDFISSDISFLNRNAKNVRCSKGRRNLRTFVTLLEDFQDRLFHTVKTYKTPILSNIKEWNEATVNATKSVVDEIQNFTAFLSSDPATCSECLKHANITSNQLEFVSSFKKCGKIVAKEINQVAKNITSQVKKYFSEYGVFVKEIEKCVRKSSQSRSRCRDSFSITFEPRCIEKLTRKVRSVTLRLFATFDLKNLESLNKTTENYETCLNSASASIQTKIADLKEKFKTCKEILALIPQLSAAVDQLKQLQAKVNNSTANQVCLTPIQTQINAILAAVSQGQANALDLTPDAIAKMTADLQTNVNSLNSSLDACVLSSQTTTTTATTTAGSISQYPLPNLCVTWKPYLNDSAPATDGYYIGNFIDGSAVYVGYGLVPGQNSQPGRLNIDSNRGLYLTIPNGANITIVKDILYMSVSPECVCSWEPISFYTPGIIMLGMVVQDGSIFNTPFVITKVDLGNNATTVARGRFDFNYYYAGVGGNEVGGSGAKTALACVRRPDSTQEPQFQPIVGETITDTLAPNQCLQYGYGLTSASGCFILKFQTDGNLVITKKGNSTILYDTKTTQKAAFQSCLLRSGKLVVYAIKDLVFDTKTSGANRAVLQNDGNLVLLSGSTVIWTSNSTQSDTTC